MTRVGPTLVVMAKAPRPGHVKTRLCPPLSADQAAQVAQASLADTVTTLLAGASRLGSGAPVVAWADIDPSTPLPGLPATLQRCQLVAQRGDGLATRIVHAMRDAQRHREGYGVIVLGADTPQLTVDHLVGLAAGLHHHDAVLGPATDGGFWALALRDAAAADALLGVPMSTPDTGRRTHAALTARGLAVATTDALRDVDCWADAVTVAAAMATGRFPTTVRRIAATHTSLRAADGSSEPVHTARDRRRMDA